MFDELANDVIQAAHPVAVDVLTKNYNHVQTEIHAAFNRYPNPLDQAIAAIVSDHENFIKRSDAQKRSAVISEGKDLIDRLPEIRKVESR